jgi:hypothetical protein
MPTVSDKDRKMSETTGEPGQPAYRGDQGRLARLAVFWALAILLFYGCVPGTARCRGVRRHARDPFSADLEVGPGARACP